MVKIRLRRTGAKKQPHYRVVVTDSRSPRDGRFIETIGHYNPRTDPATVEIDAERALHWLSVGAQPTAAVKRMLDREGILSQVGAVRKGEVSIQELAAEFRQTQAEEEAGAVLEPVYLGQEEAAPAEAAAPAEEQAAAATGEAVDVPIAVAELEEEEMDSLVEEDDEAEAEDEVEAEDEAEAEDDTDAEETEAS